MQPPVPRHRPRILLAVLLGVLFALPSLGLGFLLDDYILLSLIEGWHGLAATPFNLYSFFHEIPGHPWWISAELDVSFWRPLSSALLWLDHTLFGRQALPWHLHSVLWLGGLIAACGLVYRRVLPGRLAMLALVFFALDESHGLTTAWLANRHAMVALVPVVLGLAAHLRWREEGWRPGLPLALLGFALGLLGGETAVGALAYVVAYELLAGPGSLRRRLAALSPTLLLGLLYVLFYKAQGFGASGAGFYLDPTGKPLEFLLGAAARIPALLAAALVGFPADLWLFLPAAHPVQITVGCLALVAAVALARAASRELAPEVRRTLRWLVAGGCLALLPVAAALPSDRLLVSPMLGGAALLAFLLDHAWRSWRELAGSRRSRILAAALAIFLAIVHLGLAPLRRLLVQRSLAQQWQALLQVADRVPLAEIGDRDLVLLNAPDVFTSFYLPLIWRFEGRPFAGSWNVLSLAPQDQTVVQTGPRTLELQVNDGRLLASPYEQFIRSSDDVLAIGDTVTTSLFEVEVLAVDAQGPTQVAFHFTRDLADVALLHWGTEGMEVLELPAAGQAVDLPRLPGPAGF